MENKELKKQYNQICNCLSDRKLKQAFDLIAGLIQQNGLGLFNDELRELNQTYHLMLQYTVDGIQDPERQKVYRKLLDSAYELTDKVYEAVRLKITSSVEYDKKRAFKEQFITDFDAIATNLENAFSGEETIELSADGRFSMTTAKAEQAHADLQRLFYHFWFRDQLNDEELAFFRRALASPNINPAYQAFLVTAITLSLRRYFNDQKFALLFDAYDMDEPAIKQRALVGLLLCLYQYDSRLNYYAEITGRLKILNDDPDFKQNLERVIIQLIRSKETEKLQQRIRDELMPEMIKISSNLKDKIKLDSLMEEGLSEDENPEWQEIFEDSPELMDKMQEFSELQMEGADVFMGSFAMLKSFPFFNEIGNWFVPFFAENPDLDRALDLSDELTRGFVNVIARAPIMCNSDKYSFCLSMQQIPKENRAFMLEGLRAEMDQFHEVEQDEELSNPGKKAGLYSNQYIQDLYRFYKLHPRHADFDDLFSWRFDFHNKQVLGAILREDKVVIRNIAEYYFSKMHFQEAIEIFEFLLSQDQDGELYQKLAFAYQKLGDYEKALDGYRKAELFELNRLWNVKKIALCYRNLNQPEKALEYYQAAEAIDPENLTNHLNIGHCLLELGRYEEALKYYFKVEYLKPGNKKVWRPIGWCSFLSGKKEQAENYFQKLVADEPTEHDLMNMGHVQWSLGNRKDALDYYQQSISKPDFTTEDFFEIFEEDLPQLLKQGIDKDDVPIMLDQLRYFVEK